MGDVTTAAVVAAVSAAVLAVLCTALLAVRSGDGRRLQQTLRLLDERLAALSASIGAVVERADSDRRDELLDDLGSLVGVSLDLDRILVDAVNEMLRVPGVDAALARAVAGDEAVVRARGVPEDAAWHALPLPPFPHELRSLTVSFDYGAARPALPFRYATAVALGDPDEPLGHLAAYLYDDPGDTAAALVRLAERVTPAVRNALRLLEAEERALTDTLTGLRNRRGYDEALEREVARARRFDRPLSLMYIDLDDFGEVNKRVSDQTGDALLAQFADRVREVVRATDIACRRGGEEFVVILPESNLEAAQRACARLRALVTAEPFPDVGTVTFSAGVAMLRATDTPVEIDDRASRAMRRAKELGKDRCVPETDLEDRRS